MILQKFPPMGVYETLFKFVDDTAKYMGDPGTLPWPQGYPLTTQLPDRPGAGTDGELTWHNVWGVCNIYGPSYPFGPATLEAQDGRKGWTIERSELDVRVVFRKIMIDTQISPDPLTVSLQLISDCTNAAGAPNLCQPFQPESGSSTFNLTRYANHARGKGGVTHAQECRAESGNLTPVRSTLVITATPPPED